MGAEDEVEGIKSTFKNTIGLSMVAGLLGGGLLPQMATPPSVAGVQVPDIPGVEAPTIELAAKANMLDTMGRYSKRGLEQVASAGERDAARIPTGRSRGRSD